MRRTINPHRKPVWIGSLLALLTGCMILGQAYAFLWTEQQKLNSRNHLFWDSYLNAMYGVDKSWSPVIKRLKDDADPQQTGNNSGLRLYNADQRLLFDARTQSAVGGDASKPLNVRPLKSGDVTIGFYSIDEPGLLHPEPPFWAAAAVGSLVVGLIVGLSLKRGNRRIQALLERISFRLAILARGNGGEEPSRRSRETGFLDWEARAAEADELLKGIEDKLRQMESVRPRMIADLTQELRRPLTLLKSQLEQACIDEARLTTDKAAVLFEEVSRMSFLVTDMQQLMLAEAGRLEMEKQWFSLRSILDPLIEQHTQEAGAAGIHLRYAASREVSIYGDRYKLEQVFIHLLGNALRQARSETVVSVTANDLEVVVTVRDDGAGLTGEEIPHLFERFYRTAYDGAAAAAQPGLGFGLAIVKQYVEAHNGSVSAASAVGRGVTFTVRLPIFSQTQ
ncbi:sensor histidine kinase [Paenibacillus lutrae]|uniref:histidine kinase n=1 Tax=Paenibacillus lutrae TaxID=2078573 RepID=A0A7X3FGI8_9BACL|nr:HAMP domain-containing sensor histidine kinase [Paenibacillus lutrae]MVO99207.1 sensor histidine kinase [Paenibacillus lutrae]